MADVNFDFSEFAADITKTAGVKAQGIYDREVLLKPRQAFIESLLAEIGRRVVRMDRRLNIDARDDQRLDVEVKNNCIHIYDRDHRLYNKTRVGSILIGLAIKWHQPSQYDAPQYLPPAISTSAYLSQELNVEGFGKDFGSWSSIEELAGRPSRKIDFKPGQIKLSDEDTALFCNFVMKGAYAALQQPSVPQAKKPAVLAERWADLA